MTKQNEIEILFKAHYASMYRLALVLLHDSELARDTVHDVFAALLEMPLEMSVTESYLLTATRNRCLNRIRHLDVRRRATALYFLENEDFGTENWPDEETYSTINSIISDHLTPKARKIMELRFTCGIRFSEIAQIMGISETAVYRHLKNALIIIRQKLNDNG